MTRIIRGLNRDGPMVMTLNTGARQKWTSESETMTRITRGLKRDGPTVMTRNTEV